MAASPTTGSRRQAPEIADAVNARAVAEGRAGVPVLSRSDRSVDCKVAVYAAKVRGRHDGGARRVAAGKPDDARDL